MSRLSILNTKKIPTSTENYVGVELEFICKADAPKLKSLFIAANLHFNVNVKRDGSIDKSCTCEYEDDTSMHTHDDHCEVFFHAHEVTVLATEKDLPLVLNKVAKVLDKTGWFVNESCGLHVHLDMRNRVFDECVDRLLKHQNTMHKMCHPERRNNSYCAKIYPDEAKNKQFTDRYKDINVVAYKKFQTIEVRLHEGTTDINDVYKWCKYLTNIVDGKNWSKNYVKEKIKRNNALYRN